MSGQYNCFPECSLDNLRDESVHDLRLRGHEVGADVLGVAAQRWSALHDQGPGTHLANPSLSQRSVHHSMVTRSPNHWWASSCATTTATYSLSDSEERPGCTSSSSSSSHMCHPRSHLIQQRGLSVRDEAPVLHGAWTLHMITSYHGIDDNW